VSKCGGGFLLGPIFKELGWNDSPFTIYAAKGRYMWRDLERVCEAEDVLLKLPPVRFPQNGLKAARLALAGEGHGCFQPRRVRRELCRAERHQ
jgi:2-hydroxychromene-2-carboxylate isomerase